MRKVSNYTYQNEDINAVEISRNSKGDVTFTVKVYHESVEKAKKKAVLIFEELTKHFYPDSAVVKPEVEKQDQG